MNTTDKKGTQGFRIVKRVSVIDSMLTLPVGQSVSMEVKDFAPYQSIAAQVYRENRKARQAGKPDAFSLVGSNNYTHFLLTRLS